MIENDVEMPRYRVGNHQGRNVYDGDRYIGVFFEERAAARAVAALNEQEARAKAERWGPEVTERGQ